MVTLPAIDIINAIDYRMKNLKEIVAKHIDGLPESAEDLQKSVSELICVAEAREVLNRKSNYCVTDAAEVPTNGVEEKYDIVFDNQITTSVGISRNYVEYMVPKLTYLDGIRIYLTGTKVDKTDDFLV